MAPPPPPRAQYFLKVGGYAPLMSADICEDDLAAAKAAASRAYSEWIDKNPARLGGPKAHLYWRPPGKAGRPKQLEPVQYKEPGNR